MDHDNNAPVGAREKIRNARNAGLMDGSFKGIGRGGYDRSSSGVILVITLALALVVLLTELESADKALYALSFLGAEANRFFFGPGIPDLTGIAMADYALVIAVRTGVLLLVAGLLPLCTYLYAQAVDRAHASPYVTTWGVTIGLPLAVYVFASFFWPLLQAFYAAFFG